MALLVRRLFRIIRGLADGLGEQLIREHRGPNQQERNEHRPRKLRGPKTEVEDQRKSNRGDPKIRVGSQHFLLFGFCHKRIVDGVGRWSIHGL